MKKSKLCALLTSVCLSLTVIASAGVNSTAFAGSSKARPLWKMQKMSATASPTGYSPSQIKNAYGISSSFATGKGKTIAIVTAYGDANIKSDINTFDNQFNLSSANITVKDMGVTDSDPEWAIETALDVEWAHALAPDANILIVEAASDDSDDLLSAVDYAVNSGANVVSMSWGSDENFMQTRYDSHFSTKNGTVFVASAGDDGAGAEWPASSAKVISVGGTTLNLDSIGNIKSETAWSGSGGGYSLVESEPSWQSKFGINTYSRATPDVSFDADQDTGVSVYCSVKYKGASGWYKVGGTSLGAPSWAAIIADLNQNTTYIKNAGSFYTIAGGTGYKNTGSSFNDITSGSNGYRALRGYDVVTGLGSPKASNLAAQTLLNAATLTSSSYDDTQITTNNRRRIRRIPIFFGWLR